MDDQAVKFDILIWEKNYLYKRIVSFKNCLKKICASFLKAFEICTLLDKN